MTTKPRLTELDFIRAVAALSVVVIHVTATPMSVSQRGSLASLAYFTVNQLARFSIAAFVFITGVALFYAYPWTKPLNYWEFLKKRVTFVFAPYLVWSVLYAIVIFVLTHGAVRPTPRGFLRDLLLGNTFYHLYFIVLIFQFYILYPLFRSLLNAVRGRELVFLLITFVLYMLLMAHSQYGRWNPSSPLLKTINGLRDRNFLYWSFYFVLGGVMAQNWQGVMAWLQRRHLMIFIGFALSVTWLTADAYWFYMYRNYMTAAAASPLRPVAVIYTVFALGFLLTLPSLTANWTSFNQAAVWLGRTSFAVYLAHPLALIIADHLFGGKGIPQLVFVLISFILGVVLPLLGAVVLKMVAPRMAPYVVGK